MSSPLSQPWHRELTRYHWFVLIVAALGWLFDTMDQQLFALARVPAMKELLRTADAPATPEAVAAYGGYATSIFLIGWATGGLTFGILGDRWGRAKVMMVTILIYSLCTGLSALSVGFWDFAFYRFITGLGVGGEFAVGVSLVAEVMPDKARPFALGLLQALSAVGNIAAACTSMVLGHMEESGSVGSAWRWMFVVGTVPALLAILIRRNLKEPERWQAAAVSGQLEQQLGSYSELFGTPRWRKNALVGLALAASGVIGLWGIGFFAYDLQRSVMSAHLENEAREAGADKLTQQFLAHVVQTPSALGDAVNLVKPDELLGPASPPDMAAKSDSPSKDPVEIYKVLQGMNAKSTAPTLESVLAAAPNDAVRARWNTYLTADVGDVQLEQLTKEIPLRKKEITGKLTFWAGVTSIMLNVGAFFGIYTFSRVTHVIGRRKAFAIAFIAAFLSTAFVFARLNSFSDVFWMIPIMGFCQLSLFGGYAIYFPELFPTRLRSTGTSFCYNVGRFVAAAGPTVLGLLTGVVFKDYDQPMRYAGMSMCGVFLIGLLVLPFAPETKGQPLPE